MTLIIAHRGASASEVENSLAAFRVAREFGADAVELDVHTTGDGVPVVHHDATAGAFHLPSVRLEELRTHRLSNGEALPTLVEALVVLGSDLDVLVEVKTLPGAHDEALFEVLDAGPAPARCHVHSFDHRIIRRLKDKRSSLPCGVLSTSYPVDPLRQLADAGASELWQHEERLDHDLVGLVHGQGYKVYAWTVDDPARMRRLAEYGIDGICTNRPDLAREVLG